MKFFKHLIAILMLFCSFAAIPQTVFAAKNPPAAKVKSSDRSVQKIKKKGTLVIGTAADYPPYEFSVKYHGQNKRVGIDIDLGKQVAEDLGVKPVFKVMRFDSLLVALETHRIDMIIAAMSPTPERKQSVDFSKIYYGDSQNIVINRSDAAKYRKIKDFKGHVVGAQTGSEQYDLAKKQMPQAKLKGLDRVNNLIIALQAHKIDGVVMDSTRAKAFVANNHGLKAFNPGFKLTGQQGTAIAIAKNSPALVAAANHTITRLQKENAFDKKFVPAAGKYMSQGSKQNTMTNYWTYFATGIEYTLIISVCSVIFGFILGTIFALLRLSRNHILHAIAVCYIEFIRGTPMMVQVMFIYFGVGALVHSLSALLAGIIAISINSGAYVAEIIRSGIQSVDIGQTEAARSLGLSRKKAMRYVIMPQALRNIWPALGNEFITLVKDSSLASVIGVGELMYQTQLVQSATYKGVLPLFIAMLIYFVMTFILSRLLHFFEQRMRRA